MSKALCSITSVMKTEDYKGEDLSKFILTNVWFFYKKQSSSSLQICLSYLHIGLILTAQSQGRCHQGSHSLSLLTPMASRGFSAHACFSSGVPTQGFSPYPQFRS